MRLAILALFISVAFGANLDISDSIAPTNEQSILTTDNQAPTNATNPNNAENNANQAINQTQNNANQASQTQATQTQQAQSAQATPTQAIPAQPAPTQPESIQATPTQSAPTQNVQPAQTQPTPQPKPKKVAKPRPSDPDERLKEDIINFEREQHFQNNDKIDDPFIYVYQQTEDEIAVRAQLEQAVLILKSIIIAPDSNNRVKRYKAHINNQWVEECEGTGKNRKCDLVEGWEVTGITKDTVKLRVTRYNMNRDLKLISRKFKMKKEVNYK